VRGKVSHGRVLRLEHGALLGRVGQFEHEFFAGCGFQQEVLVALAGSRLADASRP
jgi:hypothetical protein